MTMYRIQLSTLVTIFSLACCLLVGCGGGLVRCDAPADKRLPVTLTPATILVGQETTVVASFDEPVFVNGGFEVMDTEARIYDQTELEFVGYFSDSVYRMEQGDPPSVDGVILSGEVIDERTIELLIEFPADAPIGPLRFEVVASNGGVECHTQVLGEATLEVATGS
jgi:hypothetical protein